MASNVAGWQPPPGQDGQSGRPGPDNYDIDDGSSYGVDFTMVGKHGYAYGDEAAQVATNVANNPCIHPPAPNADIPSLGSGRSVPPGPNA